MAFSGRPIRPELWLRAGFAFSPFAKKRLGYGHLVIAFKDAPREIEAQIRARDERQERGAHEYETSTTPDHVSMCITDRKPAQTRVAARFPRGALILFLASETENSFSTIAEGKTPPRWAARTRTPRAIGHDVAAGVGEDDPTRRARGRSVTASVAREILHFSPSRRKIVITGTMFYFVRSL